jgi:hypothetical protein
MTAGIKGGGRLGFWAAALQMHRRLGFWEKTEARAEATPHIGLEATVYRIHKENGKDSI